MRLIYNLSSTKIKLKDVGKNAEQIIEYLIDTNNTVEPEIYKFLKTIRDKERK